MHQEAEKLIGKQAQEVGEVRKLADELIKQNLGGTLQPIKEEDPEVDFLRILKRQFKARLIDILTYSQPDKLAWISDGCRFSRS